MSKQVVYNINKNSVISESDHGFFIDGRVMQVEPPLYILNVIENSKPDIGPADKAYFTWEINIADATYTQTWHVTKASAEEQDKFNNPVPKEVGGFQLRAAMIALGWAETLQDLDWIIKASIDAAIPDLTQRQIAYAGWDNASAFKRNHQFISLVKIVMNKNDDEIDNLFRLASTF